jgi:glycosyltransferase involved in cell wall biosynthesis
VNVLVVSSYPPRHCGIGAYAHADVERLRGQGHRVVVLSPPDGDGDHRVAFTGGRPFFAAARLGRGFDEILVHFQPRLYYPARRPVSKVMTSVGLLWLVLRRPQTRLLVHEADPPRPRWRPDYLILRAVFGRAVLRLHTQAERFALEREYGVEVRAELVPHTAAVELHASMTRDAARARLGIDPDERILLCAGFLHPAKGYDRAVRAFAAAAPHARLVVIGSVRDATPDNLRFERELRELCASTPGVTLVDDYVSDEDFDTWILAADRLILPYTRAFSSGALARAQRLGTRAIVADVGGLAEQAGPTDVVFADDAQLVDLLRDPAAG